MRFWDGNGAALHGPAKGDVSGGFAVGGCDSFENRMSEDAFGCLGHAEGEVGVGPEGGEGGDGDVLFLTKAEEVFLAKIGVHFDLQHGGLDAGIGKDFTKHGGADVGNANSFGETCVDELFHGAPGIGVGHRDGAHGLASGGPAGRIHFVEGDEFERDGEVDEVEVELPDAEIGEGLFAGRTDVLGLVVSVPELAGHPEIVASTQPGVKGGSDSFPDKTFIAVVCGAVEVAVSSFDGLVDNLWREFFGDLPGAEAWRREGGTVGKEVG